MDVGLPDMDGREAVKIMRKDGFKSPIIMLTAQTSDADAVLGLDSGANDYVEKTWPTNYSGRGGTYDYAANKPIATPKAGFLWDYAIRKGITFRDYGEFTDDDGTVYLPELAKHMCPGYPGWDLKIKDTYREKVWEHDFDSLVKANAVPQLNIVYLPSDHTAGLGKKSRTPYAYVADNDLAVGQLLEHLSHSPVWNDCAVFVLEDDAQNGADHVDAHRSILMMAGPWIKKGYISHTHANFGAVLKTMYRILDLPPVNQFDAAANLLSDFFTDTPDVTPYDALPVDPRVFDPRVAMKKFGKDFDWRKVKGGEPMDDEDDQRQSQAAQHNPS
jgi:CheY-like chemotaxis protein